MQEHDRIESIVFVLCVYTHVFYKKKKKIRSVIFCIGDAAAAAMVSTPNLYGAKAPEHNNKQRTSCIHKGEIARLTVDERKQNECSREKKNILYHENRARFSTFRRTWSTKSRAQGQRDTGPGHRANPPPPPNEKKTQKSYSYRKNRSPFW